MAKCEFCDKGVTFGIQVSHSHRRSNRTWKPNVKRVKAIVKGSSAASDVYKRQREAREGDREGHPHSRVRLHQMPPFR